MAQRWLQKTRSPRNLTPLDIESVEREAALDGDLRLDLDMGEGDGEMDAESLLSPGFQKSTAVKKYGGRRTTPTPRSTRPSPLPSQLTSSLLPSSLTSSLATVHERFHDCADSPAGRLGLCLALPAILVVFVIAISASVLTSMFAGHQPLRLNEVQLMGSRYSFHVAPTASELSDLGLLRAMAGKLNFTHVPIDKQLEGGYRFLHLEVGRWWVAKQG